MIESSVFPTSTSTAVPEPLTVRIAPWAHEELLQAYLHGPAGLLQRFADMDQYRRRQLLQAAQIHAIDWEEGSAAWIYTPGLERRFVMPTLRPLLAESRSRLSAAVDQPLSLSLQLFNFRLHLTLHR